MRVLVHPFPLGPGNLTMSSTMTPCPVCGSPDHHAGSCPGAVGEIVAEATPTAPVKSGRGLARKVALPIVALTVLGGAGTIIVGQVRDLWTSWPSERPAPAVVAGPPAPVDPRTPAHRSAVMISHQGGRTVVGLSKTRFLPVTERFVTRVLLHEELFRQALLIAAREDLGVEVRDEMLSERVDIPAGGPAFELCDAFPRDYKIRLSFREPGDAGAVLWRGDFDMRAYQLACIWDFTERLEQVSRGGMVEALKARGAKPAVARATGVGKVPESVEALLGRMDFVSQFSALRALHGKECAGIGMPERLGALARGYANLGVLTEHHWTALHRAFEARSLLYGQRVVALFPESPEARRDRAYSRGLIGLHQDAIGDLDEADRMIEKLPVNKRPTPPMWVPLLRLRLDFDTKGLLAACDNPAKAPLASIFALMSVENSAATSMALEVGRVADRVHPESLWVNDAVSQFKELGHLHVVTVQGLAMFDRVVMRDLRKVPGLPDEVAKLIDAKAGEVEVARGLTAAGARIATRSTRPGRSWAGCSARPDSPRSPVGSSSWPSSGTCRSMSSSSRPGRSSTTIPTGHSSNPTRWTAGATAAPPSGDSGRSRSTSSNRLRCFMRAPFSHSATRTGASPDFSG